MCFSFIHLSDSFFLYKLPGIYFAQPFRLCYHAHEVIPLSDFFHFRGNMIRRIPIAKRIPLLVLLVSVVPILALSVLTYRQTYLAIRQTAMDYNVRMLASMNQTVQSVVTVASTFSDTLLASPDIRRLAIDADTMDINQKGNAMRGALTTISSQPGAMAYVSEVRVVTADNVSMLSMGYSRPLEEETERHFQKASQCGTSSLWFVDTLEGKPIITLVRPIIHLGTLERYGYILIYISPEFFSFPQFNEETSLSMSLAFCDYFGTPFTLYSASTPIPSQDVLNGIHALPDTATAATYADSTSDFVCYVTVPSLDWKLISSIPYSELMRPLQPITTVITLCVAICLILCVVISHSIISSITKPLHTMVEYLGKASDMRFETELADNSDDELGYLAQSYNKICTQMRRLVSRIEDEQAHKRLAEIKMLQAQINPHFLFNTLDSLRFTAMMSSVPAVSEGLAALSHILRNSILKSNAFIPLEQEIENIRDYLVIQKIRCGDTIELNTHIQPMANRARIMKLLLQPIVENSVIHGMVEEETISIDILASVEDGMLSICVRDDGKGFVPGEKQTEQPSKSSRMSGVGLENVRERLALEFGQQQSFSIQSAPGCGTCVSITLPYTPFEGEGSAHRV